MGFRSGELPGQFSTFNLCFLKIVSTSKDERHRASWNFPPLWRSALHISGMIFLSTASIYCYEFIIPPIGISEPILQKKTKTSPEHLILGVFYYIIQIGRTELLTLADPDKSAVLPLNKKCLSSENSICPVFYMQIFMLFAHSNFLFSFSE